MLARFLQLKKIRGNEVSNLFREGRIMANTLNREVDRSELLKVLRKFIATEVLLLRAGLPDQQNYPNRMLQ